MSLALRYALLGLLSRGDMSGYDLAHKFSIEIVHYWNAHHTQIYRELQKLEAEGLLEHQIVAQQDRPDKKLYSLTQAGLVALRQWLAEAPQPPKMKNETLLRISLFHLIPPAQAIEFLEESLVMHQQVLREMHAFRDLNAAEMNTPEGKHVGQFLTMEFGMRFVSMWIDWCQFSIETFRQQRDEQDKNPTSPS